SPLKLFEFMALGLPVVAGRGGQIDDLLQDGAFGRTYEPGHAGALADAIGAVLRDRDAARRKAETARAWVLEHATWKARVDKIFRNLSASSAGVGAAG
ncbi:MAG: glycosyltransferase, partial [Planctomycetota bacterium]|nr:glycosyltransferase [Planctomycetota bacterium]